MKYYVQQIEPNRFYGFTIVLQNAGYSSAERGMIRASFDQAAEPIFRGVREQFRESYVSENPEDVLAGYTLGFVYSSDSSSSIGSAEPPVLEPGGWYLIFALLQTAKTQTGEFERLPEPEEIEGYHRELTEVLSGIYRQKNGNGGIGVVLLYNAEMEVIIANRGFNVRGYLTTRKR